MRTETDYERMRLTNYWAGSVVLVVIGLAGASAIVAWFYAYW
jgi:hypothetical protein